MFNTSIFSCFISQRYTVRRYGQLTQLSELLRQRLKILIISASDRSCFAFFFPISLFLAFIFFRLRGCFPVSFARHVPVRRTGTIGKDLPLGGIEPLTDRRLSRPRTQTVACAVPFKGRLTVLLPFIAFSLLLPIEGLLTSTARVRPFCCNPHGMPVRFC